MNETVVEKQPNKQDLKTAEITITYEKFNFPSTERLYKIIKKNNENTTITKKDIKTFLSHQEEHQKLTIPKEIKNNLVILQLVLNMSFGRWTFLI